MLRTLDYCEHLKKANFTEAQAKASVKVLSDALENHAATKIDLTLMKQSLEHEIKSLESRLTIKLGAMLTVCMALLASFLKIL